MRALSFPHYLLILILSLGNIWAQGKIEPPVIEKQVEPEYPADLKTFLLEPMSVEMVIDQEGAPFSLKSARGLPDNVVQALSKWRFRPARRNGAATASSVKLRLPIHRPIEEGLGRLTRSWTTSKELSDAFAAAKDLDPATATKMEGDLSADRENPKARLTLLAYSATTPGPDAARMQLRQILWFAKNTPDAEVLSSPLAVPNQPGSSAEASFGEIRQIWLAQLSERPENPEVLDRATNFLRFTDPEVVEKTVRQVFSENDAAEVLLGDLYGLAVLGATAADPVTGRASNAGEQLPTTPFAAKARAFLINTQNLNIFFAGIVNVSGAGPSLAKAGHLPDGYLGLCQELLARAKGYDPGTLLSCNTTERSPSGQPGVPQRIRVGGNVQQANLIKKVSPMYPPEAKSRGITGTVEFQALISKDGSIGSLSYLGGPLIFYKSARDAVLRWQYKPTTLNGNPVDVITRIDVNYTLK